MSVEIRDMFASIAPRYDIANDVLSMGIHRLWRRQLVRIAAKKHPAKILDLCTGTGDLSFAFARALPDSEIIGMDFVSEMLACAETKREQQGVQNVSFAQGDATAIPFEDNSFDLVSVAFGVRNVPQMQTCFSEIQRILKPKGCLLVLEFGQVRTPIIRQVYDWYGRQIMPLIGQAITGNRAAYEYLPKTSLKFPAGKDFISALAQSGFEEGSALPLLDGLAYIYQATAPIDSSLAQGLRTRNG